METTLPVLVIAAEYRLYKMYLRARGLHERQARFIREPSDLDGRDRRCRVVVVTDCADRDVVCSEESVARARGFSVTTETI